MNAKPPLTHEAAVRRLRRFAWGQNGLATGVVGALVLAGLGLLVPQRSFTVNVLMVIGVFACCTSIALGLLALAFFTRCPRCRLPFFSSGWWRNVATSKCVHCGLKVDGSNW